MLARAASARIPIGRSSSRRRPHRLRPGPQEVRRPHGVLLPARFQLGRATRDAAGAADAAGAGRAGAVAESDPGREAAGSRAVAIINGRLSDKSFRGYRRVRPLVASVLRQVDLIAAQNDGIGRAVPGARGTARARARHRLAQVRRRADRSRQSADAGAARAGGHRGRRRRLPRRQHAGAGRAVCARCLSRARGRTSAAAADARAAASGAVRRGGGAARAAGSRGSGGASSTATPGRQRPGAARSTVARVLLVDAVGELGAWWGTAPIAFVGGSFGPRGGQNMIEPAAYGAAVSFGPNTWNFRDIVAALLAAEAAVVVRSAAELEAFVRRCLDEPAWAATLGGQRPGARAVAAGGDGADAAAGGIAAADPSRHSDRPPSAVPTRVPNIWSPSRRSPVAGTAAGTCSWLLMWSGQ